MEIVELNAGVCDALWLEAELLDVSSTTEEIVIDDGLSLDALLLASVFFQTEVDDEESVGPGIVVLDAVAKVVFMTIELCAVDDADSNVLMELARKEPDVEIL